MYMAPFIEFFPEQGKQETRFVTVLNVAGLPADEYGFLELYCSDAECDCRRVMFNVVGKSQPKRVLATINYGFDRDDEMAGPFLDPLNPQSQYAPRLLDMAQEVLLSDPAYLARLERHYSQIKALRLSPTSARPSTKPKIVLKSKPTPAENALEQYRRHNVTKSGKHKKRR